MSTSLMDSGGNRRRKLDTMPQPPARTTFSWGHEREGLAGLSGAEIALKVIQTRAWQEVIRPACEQLDREQPGRPGPKRVYSAEELEIVLLYGTICGGKLTSEIRDLLAGDRDGEARRLFGFDQARWTHHHQRLLAGVPSVATLRRHLRRFTAAGRAEMFRAAFPEALAEALEERDFHEGARQLYMDGTSLFTHFKAPRYHEAGDGRKRLSNRPRFERDQKTGEIIRDPKTGQPKKRLSGYTARDAGYRADGKDSHKGGDGWQAVLLMDVDGLPLSYSLGKANDDEAALAHQALDFYEEHVATKLHRAREEDLAVLTADANFNRQPIKRRLHDQGIAPNIHNASHAKKRVANAKRLAKVRYPVRGHEKWFATGRFELTCACGQCRLEKRAGRDRRGKAVMRVIGKCQSCGRITITAGNWKRADRKALQTELAAQQATAPEKTGVTISTKSWMVPLERGDDPDDAEWMFGNYLTYDNSDAREYGCDRFGYNEGFNSALANRFGVGREKSWHRSKAAAEAHLLQALIVMLALAAEQARFKAGGNVYTMPTQHSGAPPGLAQAA